MAVMTSQPGRERDCPECMQGKHQNCAHQAIDPDTDELVDCECEEGGHL